MYMNMRDYTPYLFFSFIFLWRYTIIYIQYGIMSDCLGSYFQPTFVGAHIFNQPISDEPTISLGIKIE